MLDTRLKFDLLEIQPFKVSVWYCSDKLKKFAEFLFDLGICSCCNRNSCWSLESESENAQREKSWDQVPNRSPAKQQSSALPAQLPMAADLPSCRGRNIYI